MKTGFVALLGLIIGAGSAVAREVDWTAELATDVALGLGVVAINELGPDRANYVGDEFPTQDVDDKAHRRLHGEPTAPETTAKERRYRELSNVTVVGAAAMPAALASFQANEQTAGRIMTTAHALLGGAFVSSAVKHGVGRPRPKARQDENTVARDDDAASFPSGHAQSAFTGATLVSCFFPASPWWVHASGYALATATALFRIEGDKHFLTDVTAGALLGVGAGRAANAIYENKTEGLSLRPGLRSLTLVYDY